jgi:hypothetical protein
VAEVGEEVVVVYMKASHGASSSTNSEFCSPAIFKASFPGRIYVSQTTLVKFKVSV